MNEAQFNPKKHISTRKAAKVLGVSYTTFLCLGISPVISKGSYNYHDIDEIKALRNRRGFISLSGWNEADVAYYGDERVLDVRKCADDANRFIVTTSAGKYRVYKTVTLTLSN